jgi:hypothetical protein
MLTEQKLQNPRNAGLGDLNKITTEKVYGVKIELIKAIYTPLEFFTLCRFLFKFNFSCFSIIL